LCRSRTAEEADIGGDCTGNRASRREQDFRRGYRRCGNIEDAEAATLRSKKQEGSSSAGSGGFDDGDIFAEMAGAELVRR
jgi:hypothetical protein